jgi:hypothetical protein
MQGRSKFWKYFRWFLYFHAFGVAWHLFDKLYQANFEVNFWVYVLIAIVLYGAIFFANIGLLNGPSDDDPNDENNRFLSYREELHWRGDDYWKDTN